MSQEYTYQDVAEHNTKKDCYLVIHDNVYDCTKFIDEHPGGEEVILDVGGQDATEAFEDVGHSDEARETLDRLLVAPLTRKDGDPVPQTYSSSAPASGNKSDQTGLGIGVYAIMIVGGAAAYFAYNYMQSQQAQQSS